MTGQDIKFAAGRSPGLKLLLVCALAGLMTIPALFVFAIVFDRSERADQTRSQISLNSGGPQIVSGPVLAIPVETVDLNDHWITTDTLLVFAQSGTLNAHLDVKVKRKSLYGVQTYAADIAMSGQYDLSAVKSLETERRKIDLKRAKIVFGVSELRGALGDAWAIGPGGKRRRFEPFSSIRAAQVSTGQQFLRNSLSMKDIELFNRLGSPLQVGVGDLMDEDRLNLDITFRLGGAETFSVFPFARSTKMVLQSNWPHPGFDGGFLPDEKEINASGFMASRTVSSLASGLPIMAYASKYQNQHHHDDLMQVNLVEKSSPYQFVSRALKYSLMFIGFMFLTFFLFEMQSGAPVHAAQYVLIGLAQAVFYLLLLALSEHVGFDFAFAIAALSVIALTGFYASTMFGRSKALSAFTVFGSVYGLMFVLMRLDDFALLVGAVASFGAIGITMWMTRDLKWHAQTKS